LVKMRCAGVEVAPGGWVGGFLPIIM
jgi:hypothetical protein